MQKSVAIFSRSYLLSHMIAYGQWKRIKINFNHTCLMCLSLASQTNSQISLREKYHGSWSVDSLCLERAARFHLGEKYHGFSTRGIVCPGHLISVRRTIFGSVRQTLFDDGPFITEWGQTVADFTIRSRETIWLLHVFYRHLLRCINFDNFATSLRGMHVCVAYSI